MCWTIPWSIVTLAWVGAGWQVRGRARVAVRLGLGLLIGVCAMELMVATFTAFILDFPYYREAAWAAILVAGSVFRLLAVWILLGGVVLVAVDVSARRLAEGLDGDHDGATG